MGILSQPADCDGRSRDFALADSGEPRRRRGPRRLARSSSRHRRTWQFGRRFRRIVEPGLEESAHSRRVDSWRRVSYCVCSCRGQGCCTDTLAHVVQIPQLQCREPAYSFFVCGHWNFLFSVPLEPDPGPGILHYGNRRGYFASDSAYVFPLALVWRTCCPLWSTTATDGWSTHCRVGLRIVRRALDREQLLEGVLPADACSRVWNGGHGSSSYHRRHEFSD